VDNTAPMPVLKSQPTAIWLGSNRILVWRRTNI